MDPNLEFAEEWLPVVGYEGHYLVSNLGRVQSVPRSVTDKNGVIYWRKGKLLRPGFHGQGYLLVRLYKGGKGHTYFVHTLISTAFLGPRPPGLTVDHKDGNKVNNSFGNLEYITNREQTERAVALGNFVYVKSGEKHPMAKLTDTEITEIRRLHLEGLSNVAIAKQFAVGRQHISNIINGRTRKSKSEDQEQHS